MVHFKQCKIMHPLLAGAQKLSTVTKKLSVPTKKVHQHQTKQKAVNFARPLRAISTRLLKCNTSQYFNTFPTNKSGNSR